MRRSVVPSPAFWLALLSLFVSLGGTTYAITALPRNSVGTEQIRPRAVTEDDLSSSSVITPKLANGAVRERKIARNAITGSRVAANTLGGAQIDESSLLAVPSAQQAETAKIATRAHVADRVERVARADAADTAERAALADRAVASEHAEQADQADEAALAAVAQSLADVDMNFESVTLAEGFPDIFTVECDAGLTPINGGFFQTDDFGDLTTIVGSGPQLESEDDPPGWFVIVDDRDADFDGADTAGIAYSMCFAVDVE